MMTALILLLFNVLFLLAANLGPTLAASNCSRTLTATPSMLYSGCAQNTTQEPNFDGRSLGIVKRFKCHFRSLKTLGFPNGTNGRIGPATIVTGLSLTYELAGQEKEVLVGAVDPQDQTAELSLAAEDYISHVSVTLSDVIDTLKVTTKNGQVAQCQDPAVQGSNRKYQQSANDGAFFGALVGHALSGAEEGASAGGSRTLCSGPALLSIGFYQYPVGCLKGEDNQPQQASDVPNTGSSREAGGYNRSVWLIVMVSIIGTVLLSCLLIGVYVWKRWIPRSHRQRTEGVKKVAWKGSIQDVESFSREQDYLKYYGSGDAGERYGYAVGEEEGYARETAASTTHAAGYFAARISRGYQDKDRPTYPSDSLEDRRETVPMPSSHTGIKVLDNWLISSFRGTYRER